MQIKMGADCVVRNEHGDILLIKREDFRFWTIPGGAAEAGESPAQAAAREAYEESGVEVAVDDLVGIYTPRNGSTLMFVYAAHPVDGLPHPTDESLDSRYFAPHSIPRRMLGVHRQRLFDALSSERCLYRCQPKPFWMNVVFPPLLRVRKWRNQRQGRPEPPVIRHSVIVRGELNNNGSGALTFEVEPQFGAPIWDTLRASAEQLTGEPLAVTRLTGEDDTANPIVIRFALQHR